MKKKPAARKKTMARPKAKAVSKVQVKAKKKIHPVKAKTLQPTNVIPGEIILGEGDIVALEGRPLVDVIVANTGDRPIQVGSHCHFFEANGALRFDREAAFGFRLQVPAGTAVRFEPGEEKLVTLVAIGGHRVGYGINGLTEGGLDDAEVRARALARAMDRGFSGKGMP